MSSCSRHPWAQPSATASVGDRVTEGPNVGRHSEVSVQFATKPEPSEGGGGSGEYEIIEPTAKGLRLLRSRFPGQDGG